MKIIKRSFKGQDNEPLTALVLSDLHISSESDIPIFEDIMLNVASDKYDAIYLVGDILDSTNVLYKFVF